MDNIHNEFLKYGTENLIDEMTEIMKEVFRTNVVPKSWLDTVQVPIPNINHPRNVDDYRCITQCSSSYKIYAKLLLKRLKD